MKEVLEAHQGNAGRAQGLCYCQSNQVQDVMPGKIIWHRFIITKRPSKLEKKMIYTWESHSFAYVIKCSVRLAKVSILSDGPLK